LGKIEQALSHERGSRSKTPADKTRTVYENTGGVLDTSEGTDGNVDAVSSLWVSTFQLLSAAASYDPGELEWQLVALRLLQTYHNP
jgi:hypothetical protein